MKVSEEGNESSEEGEGMVKTQKKISYLKKKITE